MENIDTKQILKAISNLSDKTDKRFDAVINDIHDLRKESQDNMVIMSQFAQNIEDRLGEHDERFNKIETRIDHALTQLVTKDYLDDKLADLRSDLGLPIRQTNVKVHTLTDELVEKKVFTTAKAKTIKALPPFAATI